MTRTGKIARLPRAIREQLNRRLQDGKTGVKLVKWLNMLPEVREVLSLEFGGRAISEQNLTEWKQGGYCEWLRHRETLELARELSVDADDFKKIASEPLADKLSPLLLAKYMLVIKELSTVKDDDPEGWKKLRDLCGDVVALRKGDHSAERLKIERECLEIDRERCGFEREQMVINRCTGHDSMIDMFLEPARENPKLMDAAMLLCEAIVKNGVEKHGFGISAEIRLKSKISDFQKSFAGHESNQIKPDQTKAAT